MSQGCCGVGQIQRLDGANGDTVRLIRPHPGHSLDAIVHHRRSRLLSGALRLLRIADRQARAPHCCILHIIIRFCAPGSESHLLSKM